MKPDWKDAPEWAQYRARDDDGELEQQLAEAKAQVATLLNGITLDGNYDEQTIAELIAAERERCAVTAWNHFADTCKRKGLNPCDKSVAEWLAAAAIRGETK